MGVEYFIVKPNKKEVFYLGKHVEGLDCMRRSHATADYLDCDCFHDFFLDLLDNNPDGLVGDERTLEDIREFAYLLYEWCDDKVYFSNDCCGDAELWKDYKETGSIIDFCEKHPCYKDILDDFIDRLDPMYIYKFEEDTLDYDRIMGRLP